MTTLAPNPVSPHAHHAPQANSAVTPAGEVPRGDHPVEHAKYQIANSPVLGYPFPHQAVGGVFPADYYAQLQANFPEERHFRPLIENYPQRGTIELHAPGALDGLDAAKREFWAWFLRGFGSRDFMAFVLERYEPLLAHRFRLSVKPQMYLFRDTGGYGIGPHTDTTKKVVTMLFYLPEDDSQRHAGTSIVVPNNPGYQHRHTGHEAWDDYRAARTVEFLPNTLVSFVVTDRSLHAVRPTPPGTVRKSLQMFICQE
jgi:hypothetical protein